MSVTAEQWAADARRQGMREDMVAELLETIAAGFAVPYRDGDGIGLQITDAGRAELKVTELDPHAYVPSVAHMGDCAICGHLQGAPIHSPFKR